MNILSSWINGKSSSTRLFIVSSRDKKFWSQGQDQIFQKSWFQLPTRTHAPNATTRPPPAKATSTSIMPSLLKLFPVTKSKASNIPTSVSSPVLYPLSLDPRGQQCLCPGPSAAGLGNRALLRGAASGPWTPLRLYVQKKKVIKINTLI